MARLPVVLLFAFSVPAFAADYSKEAKLFGYSDDDIQSEYQLCGQWAEEEDISAADKHGYVEGCVRDQLPIDYAYVENEQKHQISIGTTTGLWQFVLQNRLIGLHDQFSNLALRAESHTSGELLRLVTERALDMAILYEPTSSPELTAKPVGKLKLVLASSIPGVTVKSAFQSHYVFVDWGTAFAMFHAKRFGDAPPAILHTNTASIAESFIRDRQGSAYLPVTIVTQEGNENISEIEGAPSFSKDIYAVYRSNSERMDLIREITQHLASSSQ